MSRVREMPESTRTAKDAASAIGTTVDQLDTSKNLSRLA